MLRSLYTAATGMDAQQTKLDIIAHNLANASTTGFKKMRADFQDLLSETIRASSPTTAQGGSQPTALQVGLGVRTASTSRSFAQGDMIQTKNPLDVAIGGSGFFRIQRANGDLAYTRDGSFRLDATGRLVTQLGELLEPGITLPPDATSISIKPDGTVQAKLPNKTDLVDVGNIQLATFANPGGMEAIGDNLLLATSSSGDPIVVKPGDQGTGGLSQGTLEGSNVSAVEEMINMISTQRNYELNSKIIESADEMLQKLSQIR
jgi:flagellar basal-body rod protein FlgG